MAAIGRDRGDHRIRNFQPEAYGRTHGAANDLADRTSDSATRSGAVPRALNGGGLGKGRARCQQRSGNQRNGKAVLHRVLQ